MQVIARGTSAALIAAVASALLAACHSDAPSADALRAEHREILSRLADLESKIDRLGTRPAPASRPLGPDPDRAYDLPLEGSPVKGPADAPLTVVEFSDYQCPFCARSEGLMKQVLAAYPTQARLVYKHFPLSAMHPQALTAALAAAAAQRQGKFWEMHEILFANQRALSPEQIDGYARQIGLNMERFKADMQSPEVKEQVEADRRLARRAGVRGTPTVFVNGRLLQNRTLEGVRALAEPILKGAAAPPAITPRAGG